MFQEDVDKRVMEKLAVSSEYVSNAAGNVLNRLKNLSSDRLGEGLGILLNNRSAEGMTKLRGLYSDIEKLIPLTEQKGNQIISLLNRTQRRESGLPWIKSKIDEHVAPYAVSALNAHHRQNLDSLARSFESPLEGVESHVNLLKRLGVLKDTSKLLQP